MNTPTPMVVGASPALARWRERFAAEPVLALEALLTGRVNLGVYNRARPVDALEQLLDSAAERAAADTALLAWFEHRLDGPPPPGLSARRFAGALVEALSAVQRIPLPLTHAWLALRHGRVRGWLRGFRLGAGRDPESALFLALASHQPDRALQPLWLGLCRLDGDAPTDHGRLGLIGLRLLPADDQGRVEHGLPKALLAGLLAYGEALARRGEKKPAAWHGELDFYAAVYPMSETAWGRRFREAIGGRKPSPRVSRWLDQRYPLALKGEERREGKERLLPSIDEREEMQRLVRDQPLEALRDRLAAFFERYRKYTAETGDAYNLVHTFSNFGAKLISSDPAWTRDLAHEAARWAPQDPHVWSTLAKALEATGDWRRAEAVLWHARRRFPHDAPSHTQLGHALVLHGEAALGEAVYREAIRLFPDDAFCWSDLAHTLKVTGRPEEALTVYREAQGHGHQHDPVNAAALTDTLLDLRRLEEAEGALEWAERVADPHDDKGQRTLQAIRDRLRRARSGERQRERQLAAPREDNPGDPSTLADITGSDFSHAPLLGRVTLQRRGSQPGAALRLLEQLPAGAERTAETALAIAADRDWPTAAAWLAPHLDAFAGDGVLRVHLLRARARSGESVDWGEERERYPELRPVIVAEAQGSAPRPELDPEVGEPDADLALDHWFAELFARADAPLRDLAEEDLLAARHRV